MRESLHGDKVVLLSGDCLELMETLESNSIDSCCCDPPYHLTSIVERFGADNAAPAQFGQDGVFKRSSAGFMGQTWDGGDIAFRKETWEKVYRVLKPGAYIVAFSSSRTYHRMACAIEDAGFITHPMIGWIFGQGFPKAHNLGKRIDKMAGVEREVVGTVPAPGYASRNVEHGVQGREVYEFEQTGDPVTPEAQQWEGWYYGTQSLKPALEPIYVGQKPFEKGLNGAENVLKWGVGAINIDGCRIGDEPRVNPPGASQTNVLIFNNAAKKTDAKPKPCKGRWPANVIHDGSEEAIAPFPESDGAMGDVRGTEKQKNGTLVYGDYSNRPAQAIRGDTGSAARFFYQAKADKYDRAGSRHPTVKPVDLIAYLIRLVAPPNGLVLDPFAGSGTAGSAALRENRRIILIEAEPKYQEDIRRRLTKPIKELIRPEQGATEDLPLFGGEQ